MSVAVDRPGRARRREVGPTSDATRARRFAVPLAVAGAALATAVLVRAVDPAVPGHYPVCPVLAVTGLYCPLCGGLRAVHDLSQGDLAGALSMNPLVVLGLPLLAGAWWRWLRRSARGAVGRGSAATWPAWVTFGVLLAFGLARNLPALRGLLGP